MPSKSIAEQCAAKCSRTFATVHRLEQQTKDIARRLEAARIEHGKQLDAANQLGIEMRQNRDTGIYQLVPPVHGWDEDQPQ